MTFANSKTLPGEREGGAQIGARRRACQAGQVRELVLHPARTGGAQVGAGGVVRRAHGAHADEVTAQAFVAVHAAEHHHGAHPPSATSTRTCQMEEPRANGVWCSHNDSTAVIWPSSVGIVPVSWFEYVELSDPSTPDRKCQFTASTCQGEGERANGVGCSHSNVTAVQSPSSVGNVPVCWFPSVVLSDPSTPHHKCQFTSST